MDLPPNFLHLSLQILQLSGVVNHKVCELCLFLERHLRLEMVPDLALAEAVSFPQPPFLSFRVARHQDDGSEPQVDSILEQQRRLVDDDINALGG